MVFMIILSVLQKIKDKNLLYEEINNYEKLLKSNVLSNTYLILSILLNFFFANFIDLNLCTMEKKKIHNKFFKSRPQV